MSQSLLKFGDGPSAASASSRWDDDLSRDFHHVQDMCLVLRSLSGVPRNPSLVLSVIGTVVSPQALTVGTKTTWRCTLYDQHRETRPAPARQLFSVDGTTVTQPVFEDAINEGDTVVITVPTSGAKTFALTNHTVSGTITSLDKTAANKTIP
jgi:hypothetical protein